MAPSCGPEIGEKLIVMTGKKAGKHPHVASLYLALSGHAAQGWIA